MENLEVNLNFWKGRSVFITGHTGFKGGWLSLWLSQLGAKVYGYSLKSPTSENFFNAVNLEERIENSTIGDICNKTQLTKSMKEARPSVIFHLAAQPLVRSSYNNPIETFTTNVIGTANVLEATRQIENIKAIVNVTTDKVYENQERGFSFKENDRLGGLDPYSSSKACAENITSSYRHSFLDTIGIKLASVRAGNVIGGGDWAVDRLIPDFFRSIKNNETLIIRSPKAIRPWQHVLDPLSGYLLLAEKLVENGNNFAEAWNFGPEENDAQTVSWVLSQLSKKFTKAKWESQQTKQYEANTLKLDISKAKAKLGWMPRWSLEQAINNTVDWFEAFNERKSMAEFSIKQIKDHQTS
tara:strand:- start:29413 stop:30477 length:1065 start_codon:yes stop_codon:yes gene_type:complete